MIVAEPGALLSFTGPRVVQQTTREKLPGRLRPRRVRTSASATSTRSSRGPSCGRTSRGSCGSSAMPTEPELRLRERLARLRNLTLLGGARVSGELERLQRQLEQHPDRADRRGDLALGRARAAPGPAVHARLRRAAARRLGRAARRPRPRRRRGDRRRPRPLRRPHGRARRPPEGPRHQGADASGNFGMAVSGGLSKGDARDGARRPARLPAAQPRRHPRRLPGRRGRAARPGRRDRAAPRR